MKKRISCVVLAVVMLLGIFIYGPVGLEKTRMNLKAESNNYDVFLQRDMMWNAYTATSNGKSSTQLGPTGCGLFSLMNAVYYLNGNVMDIKSVADWAWQSIGSGCHYWGQVGSDGRSEGTYRDLFYPNITAACGALYGFNIPWTGAHGYSPSQTTLQNHFAAGRVCIGHIPNHFICLAGYDSSSGRYLVLDSAASYGRYTSMGGSWLTWDELAEIKFDWYCAVEKTGNGTISNYNVTGTASNDGIIDLGLGKSTGKRGAGTMVFFKAVPNNGKKVASVSIKDAKGNVITHASTVNISNGPAAGYFAMPSSDVTISVTYTSGGISLGSGLLTSSAGPYTLGSKDGITMRSDISMANTYVGLFDANDTSYSIGTSMFYAPSQFFYGIDAATNIQNGAYCGKTIAAETMFKGGNIAHYGSGSYYKLVCFNSAGTAISTSANVSVVNNGNVHIATAKFVKNIVAPYKSMNPVDVVFDSDTAVSWVTAQAVHHGTVALGADSGGDKGLLATATQANGDYYFELPFSRLSSTISASTYKYISIVAKSTADKTREGRLYWVSGSASGYSEANSVAVDYESDGLWHEYLINMSSVSSWTGTLSLMRFDFYNNSGVASGEKFLLRSMRFYQSAPSSPTVSTEKATYTVGENIKIAYSGISSYLTGTENRTIFTAIYAEGTSPANGRALMYAPVSAASGTVTFPSAAIGGTKLGQTLPEGNYAAWISYDSNGTTQACNLNNVHFASRTSAYAFKIVPKNPVSSNKSTSSNTGGNVIKSSGAGTFANWKASIESALGTSSFTIYKKDGTTAVTSGAVGTGMIVKSGSTSYTVIYSGDIDGNGAVNISDVNSAYSALRGKASLTGAYLDAALNCGNQSSVNILTIISMLNLI